MRLIHYKILLITILFSSCSLALKRSNKLYQKALIEQPYYDAIIVPGIPYNGEKWDSIMKARVVWSVYLYKQNFTKNIIYSGSAVYTKYYEAMIMGLYAQKLGVKPENIFYDTLAKHSTENVYYSYRLAQCNGFKSIALTTDPFQSALLGSYTKRRFRSPIPHIPVQFEILKTMQINDPIIEDSLAIKSNFISILKTEGFFKRLWGTLGKQVYYGPDRVLGKL